MLLWLNIFFHFLYPLFAQNYSSSNFKIDFGNINLTSGSKTSPSFNLTDTVGQNAPGQFNSSTTLIKSGFQYIYDNFKFFKFSISNLNIAFGSLVPGTPSTATNTLTITTPYGQGYNILALETNALSNQVGNTIPDTKCDSNTCSESTSGAWTSNSIYGFGLNASGAGSSGIFSASSQYRQFANQNLGESPQIIATENSSVTNRQTTITYKINIPATQASGDYQNKVIFIAIPKY